MSMDVSNTIVANSDQINAADLTGSPVTVTIREVTKGNPDQPVHVHLKEIADKTFRPSKSMRRVMVKLWGADASQWAGKRVTLYNDPSVKWAGQPVGGVRISHASGISEPVRIPLQVARGKIEQVTVQPLPDAPSAPATDTGEQITDDQWAAVQEHLEAQGATESADRAKWVQEYLGRQISSPKAITKDEADLMLADLTGKEKAA